MSSLFNMNNIYRITNNKRLGIYYIICSIIYGICGTLISIIIRIELYSSGNRIISIENMNFYNINITLHGIIMIFFLIMPGLFGGFGNYFIPIFHLIHIYFYINIIHYKDFYSSFSIIYIGFTFKPLFI